MTDKKCVDKVKDAFEGRMEDIRTLFHAEKQTTEDLGSLDEYGLSIDYVEPGTFKGQWGGYLRYQLSCGGPSEEFRIFDNGDVEFWYLDWIDGAPIEVTGEDADIIKEITTWNERK